MKETLKSLVELYDKIGKDIERELEELPRYGSLCDCNKPDIFKQIFSGHQDEIMCICVECGGYVEYG